MFQLNGLFCPICSQMLPHGKSLQFHLKACLSKHLAHLKQHYDELPPETQELCDIPLEQFLETCSQLHQLPQMPQIPKSKSHFEEYNDWSQQFYQACVLVPCDNCGRRYHVEAFLKHPCRKGKTGAVKTLKKKKKRLGGSSKSSRSSQRENAPAEYSLDLDRAQSENLSSPSEGGGRGLRSSRMLLSVGDDEFMESPRKPSHTQEQTSPSSLPPLKSSPNASGARTSPGKRLKKSPRTTAVRRSPRVKKSPNRLGSGKPVAFTCHLCGREFGTSSFEIHLPQCAKKAKKQQSLLPKFLQKPIPSGPTIGIPQRDDPDFLDKLQEYNQEANYIHQQATLSRCPKCSRTFKPESLLIHMRSCCPDQLSKATDSTSSFKGGGSSSFGGSSSSFGRPNTGKPVAFTCYLCGREFGTTSFKIHLPQCAKKSKKHQSHLPKFLQKPLPEPPRMAVPKKGDPDFLDKLHQYNEEANHIHQQATLSRCPSCKRTFNPESLLIHMRSCCPDKLAQNTDSSGDAGGSGYPKLGKAPKTLTCYLCAKQFLSSSIKYHLPKCEQQWLNNQKMLPTEYQRKTLPDAPQSSIKKRNAYNEEAYQIYMENSRVTCQGCGRRFEPDAFLRHAKSCAGSSRGPSRSGGDSMTRFDKAPKTIVCFCCGQSYGSHSIGIHQKQCIAKREKQLKDVPHEMRRPLRYPSQPLPLTKSGKISTKRLQAYNEEASQLYNAVSLFPCQNCGRTFRLEALKVHQRSCKPAQP